jgi:multidrug/hemolysin transport system permease protein
MKSLIIFTRRNIKLFFKDKGLFFTSLITPAILLVLYSTFLGNVYTDSLSMALPEGFTLSDELLRGFSGAQLISSILSVSCVTVAFCSNMLMVQDKVSGTIKDLTVSPVHPSVLSLGYFIANLSSTLTVCFTAEIICLIYVAATGWFLTFADVCLLTLDVLLMTLFGVALSSIVNFFLKSQGQISAVGTMVSSGYGFISGAYMPISQFPDALAEAIAFFPGTYGTALFRNHSMRGVLSAMADEGLPSEFIDSVRDNFDCNIYLLDNKVSLGAMLAIISLTVIVLIGAYILINYFGLKKSSNK